MIEVHPAKAEARNLVPEFVPVSAHLFSRRRQARKIASE